MSTISLFHAQNRTTLPTNDIYTINNSGHTTSYWSAALDNWVVISYYNAKPTTAGTINFYTGTYSPVNYTPIQVFISNNSGYTFRHVNFQLQSICGANTYASTFSYLNLTKNVKLYNISGNYFLCGMSTYFGSANVDLPADRKIWYVNVKYAYDNYTDTTNVMGFNSINTQDIGAFYKDHPDLDYGVLNDNNFYFFTIHGSLSIYTDLNTNSIEISDNNTSENNCSIAFDGKYATMSNRKWILHGLFDKLNNNMNFSRYKEYLTAGKNHWARTIDLKKFSCKATNSNLFSTSYDVHHLTVATNEDALSSSWSVGFGNTTSYIPCVELVTSQYNINSGTWLDTNYNVVITKKSTTNIGYYELYRINSYFKSVIGDLVMVGDNWVYITLQFNVDGLNSGNTTRCLTCLVRIKLQTPAYFNLGGADGLTVGTDYNYSKVTVGTNNSYYGNITSSNPTLFGEIVMDYPETYGNGSGYYSDPNQQQFWGIKSVAPVTDKNIFVSTVEGVFHTSTGFM
jgi:hypothetical protein